MKAKIQVEEKVVLEITRAEAQEIAQGIRGQWPGGIVPPAGLRKLWLELDRAEQHFVERARFSPVRKD